MDINAILILVLWLVIIGLIFYVLWWMLGKIAPPEPFNKIAQVLLVLLAGLICIYFLLHMLPVPGSMKVFR